MDSGLKHTPEIRKPQPSDDAAREVIAKGNGPYFDKSSVLVAQLETRRGFPGFVWAWIIIGWVI